MDDVTAAVSANIRAELARRPRGAHLELGRSMRLSKQALSRRLNGHQVLTVPELVTIAAWLGVSPLTLLGQPAGPRTTQQEES